jgi:hypothetical protein
VQATTSCFGDPDNPGRAGGAGLGFDVRAILSVQTSTPKKDWVGGDFDADHGLGLGGADRSVHWGRARGPSGAEAADVCCSCK